MEFENLVTLVGTNGIAVVIIIYFLYKDYKFNQAILDTLNAINVVLTKLETWHAKGDSNVDIYR